MPVGPAEAPAPEPPRPRARTEVRRGRSRSRRGRVFVVLALLTAVFVLPVVVAVGWYWLQVHPTGSPGAEKIVEVRPGWGVTQIGNELERQDIIGSTLAFRLYLGIDGNATFSAGTYTLRQGSGIADAVAVLRKGPTVVYGKLALPPGLTIDEIATRVGQLPGRSRDKFLALAKSGTVRSQFQPAGVNSLEGLTWPDTYFVTDSEDELAILRRIVQTFDERATELGLPGDAPPGITPYQTIIVASLIQTEAKLDEDRALIASVIYNRLRDNMLLQIDATLLYSRGNKTDPIRNSDKQIDSPYNTYKVKGLPPTPISTVSKASLQAAMNPATTAYKYYVLADANGRHAFGVTLEDHERNVAAARKKGLL